MALSPGLRYSARKKIERQLSKCVALDDSDSLHIQIRALENDVKRVRSLPTIADRIDMKRDELLPRWLPTVEKYLTGDVIFNNPVFSYCVVWLFDVGEFDQGLDMADIAIKQRQKTPKEINRTFEAFVADTILEWASEAANLGESLEPYFSRTFDNVRDHWQLHEMIRGKWFKFAGLNLLRDKSGDIKASNITDIEVLERSDVLLKQAHNLDPRVGVNTTRQKIAARIRALQK